MLTYHRLWLYDLQSLSPVRPESSEDNPEHSVRIVDFRPFYASFQDHDLVL